MLENTMLKKPYPRKCPLPFILYPPGLRKNIEGDEFLERNIDMQVKGGDFVLYIGIPFCRKECKSCTYFIHGLPYNDTQNLEERYIEALLKDLDNWAKFPRWNTGLIRAIYIGGGTGSIIKTKNIKRIVDKIYSLFKVADDCEFTLEGNASDFDQEKIEYVAKSKINRLSLGVQSFQPEMLETIGSLHDAQDSIRVIRAFQEQGFKNIQLDLIYNLPGQTLDIWKKDLLKLKELNITHFTIYVYRLHKEKLQAKLIEQGKVEAPPAPDSNHAQEMYKTALEIAKQMGFDRYMLNHFCIPGYEGMYNYWNWKVYEETLAVGPGSYSYFGDYRLGTEADVNKYIDYCNNGKFLISSISEKLPERVKRERYIIFTLLYYEVQYKYYFNKFHSSFLEDFKEEIERLQRKGLAEVGPEKMTLTELGDEWHSNVLLEFFDKKYWKDENSLNETNWSLNGASVEAGSLERSFWLGNKEIDFY